jgi:hypothetical protein
VVSDRFRGRRMTRFPRGQLIMNINFRPGDPFDAPGELNVQWHLRSNLFNEEAEDYNELGVHVDDLRTWCAEVFQVDVGDVELWCDRL